MAAGAETYEQRVTPLELFFDLVFVFAITRVTALMAHDLSWSSIGRGLLVLAALFGGIALYLFAHVAFKLRATGSLGPHRLVAAVVCVACVPIGTAWSALASLAVVTAISVALIAYEVIRFR